MATQELTIPAWARSRTAKLAAVALVAFIIGFAGGSSQQGPTELVASPQSTVLRATVTVAAPTVTVDGPPRTVEVAGPTVTVVRTTKVRVTKTVRVTAQAAAAAPLADAPDGSQDVYYANCSEARAADAAPLYRGDPGYASHLDRDNDGVACE